MSSADTGNNGSSLNTEFGVDGGSRGGQPVMYVHPTDSRPELSCSVSSGTFTVSLHIIAIFVIFFASFLGTFLPLIGKYIPFLQIHPFAIIIGKCISSGVVMAVAMVHVMNKGVLGFLKDCTVPALRNYFDASSLLIAMVAAMSMHALDTAMDTMLETWSKSNGADRSELTNDDAVTGEPNAAGGVGGGGGCHSHGAVAAARLNSAKRVAAAVSMEFGLALHSVFLGLSVGIANDAETRALLVALAFHQVFEGLALGSRLVDAAMNVRLELLMMVIYSISVPLGTVVGLVTVTATDISMTGTTFITAQAILDSICAGILLYLGFTLILNDFPEDLRTFAGVNVAHRGWKRFGMFLALWGGMGVMTLLGKWA